MPNSEMSSQNKVGFRLIVTALIVLVIGAGVLYMLYTLVPTSPPLFFIAAGILLFSIPGLFHPDPKQTGGPLSTFAYRCYQLVQDDDPSTPGKISLAKFQMLFWTIILAASFVWLLLHLEKTPQIPSEWLILMGISNGTYVLSKWAKTVKEVGHKSENEASTKAPG
ncbi:MAG TPA: hypothetical protein VF478_05335 [Anaerolineae bacterium]